MCNQACLEFVARAFTASDVAGRTILEVGALDVNGSPRAVLEPLGPARYIGVDLVSGAGVDEVVSVEQLVDRFGPSTFDIVVSTEMIEHVRDWRAAIADLATVVKPGGLLVITTRSAGFPYHAYPHDYWRFEVDDLRAIFQSWEIDLLERDASAPGAFVRCRRSAAPGPPLPGLEAIELYSMAIGRRTAQLPRLAGTRSALRHAPGSLKAGLAGRLRRGPTSVTERGVGTRRG